MVGAGLEGRRACSCAVIFFVLCSKCSTSHLPRLNCICHFSAHTWNWSISCCILLYSPQLHLWCSPSVLYYSMISPCDIYDNAVTAGRQKLSNFAASNFALTFSGNLWSSFRFCCAAFTMPKRTSVWTVRSWASSKITTLYLRSRGSPIASRSSIPSVKNLILLWSEVRSSNRTVYPIWGRNLDEPLTNWKWGQSERTKQKMVITQTSQSVSNSREAHASQVHNYQKVKLKDKHFQKVGKGETYKLIIPTTS